MLLPIGNRKVETGLKAAVLDCAERFDNLLLTINLLNAPESPEHSRELSGSYGERVRVVQICRVRRTNRLVSTAFSGRFGFPPDRRAGLGPSRIGPRRPAWRRLDAA